MLVKDLKKLLDHLDDNSEVMLCYYDTGKDSHVHESIDKVGSDCGDSLLTTRAYEADTSFKVVNL